MGVHHLLLRTRCISDYWITCFLASQAFRQGYMVVCNSSGILKWRDDGPHLWIVERFPCSPCRRSICSRILANLAMRANGSRVDCLIIWNLSQSREHFGPGSLLTIDRTLRLRLVFRSIIGSMMDKITSTFKIQSSALVSALIAVGTALCGFSPVNADEFSKYLEESYLRDTMEQIDSLIYEDLVSVLKILEPADAAASIMTETVAKTEKLIDRATNIAAGKLKAEDSSTPINDCEYFFMAVALRGVHESLVIMQSCSVHDCDRNSLSKEHGRLFFHADRLDKLARNCPLGVKYSG